MDEALYGGESVKWKLKIKVCLISLHFEHERSENIVNSTSLSKVILEFEKASTIVFSLLLGSIYTPAVDPNFTIILRNGLYVFNSKMLFL